MNPELVIAVIGIIMVTVDIVVRLLIAPTRRDRFVRSLLEFLRRNG